MTDAFTALAQRQEAKERAALRAVSDEDLTTWLATARREIADLGPLPEGQEWFADIYRRDLEQAEAELHRRDLTAKIASGEVRPAITPEVIREVKDKTDLVGLFEGYGVVLRQNGATYKGLCPWHPDETPSLVIWPGPPGRYRCFGCNVRGDAISFVEVTQSLRFVQAVRHLAGQAGIALPDLEKKAPDDKAPVFQEDHLVYTRAPWEIAFSPRRKRFVVNLRRDGVLVASDVVDPASLPERRRLLRQLKNEDRELVGTYLLECANRLTADLRAWQLERVAQLEVGAAESAHQEAERQAAERASHLKAITEQALEILKDPALLYEAGEIIHHLGVVGEEANIRQLYVCLTSRINETPISVFVKGESAGGKSWLVKWVLQLFPASAYLVLTGMSERALIYTDEDFRHRFIVIFEAHGMEVADYLIRTLQSEGRIVYVTVEKTPLGLQGRRIDKPGPTGFISTTTSPELHQENETRVWSLLVDETPEQTKQVKKASAARHSNGGYQVAEEELAKWRAAQEYLELAGAKKAVISFAGWLADQIPDRPLRVRRDFERLLVAIEAVALLYQLQRSKDASGNVIVEVADYHMARRLFEDTLRISLVGFNEKTQRLVDAIAQLRQDDKLDEGVSYRQVAERLGLRKDQVSRWLRPALAAGVVENREGRKGVPARLVLGLPMGQAMSLPDTSELAAAFPHLATRPAIDPISGNIVAAFPSAQHCNTATVADDRNASTEVLQCCTVVEGEKAEEYFYNSASAPCDPWDAEVCNATS